MTDELYQPLRAGDLQLANRLVMAPMARRRAGDSGVPSEHAPLYYAQRASAGLIVTEGTAPCAGGKGSLRMPAIFDASHVAGWRKVTDAVHARGGRIVVQLMHSGRVAHSSRLSDGALPVAPSAVRPAGQIMAASGMTEYEVPRALELHEIPKIVEEYAHAARCAIEAGFDGVELHGASGFLPMQFLCSSTNRRTDAYGGSAGNRARFTIEVLQAMAAAIGAGRVGIKLSPENPHNDISDANPVETFGTLVSAISGMSLAYLHVAATANARADHIALLRPLFKEAYFVGGGLTSEKATSLLASGKADAAVFGVLFLANPDLPERFRRGAALNEPDRDTFYTVGPRGYTDYPVLEDATA